MVGGEGKALDAGRAVRNGRKSTIRCMRPVLLTIAGALIAVAGAIWILQGMNVIVSESFMTGSRIWVVIGAVAVVGGVALSWFGWSRR